MAPDLKDLIQSGNFRQVTPADATTLLPLYSECGGPPRFWRSISYLSASSANVIGTHLGCMVVLRRKILHGHPMLYFLFPPLGPTPIVKKVLAEYAEVGISAKVSDYDIIQYKLRFHKKDNDEHFYQGADNPPEGKIGKHLRYGLNRLARFAEEGKIKLVAAQTLTTTELHACLTCAKKWYVQRKGVRGTEYVIRAFAALPTKKHAHIVYDNQNNVIALSLTESIGEHAAIIVRLRDYESELATGLIGGLHALDCQVWKDSLLTIGSAVGVTGLEHHKEALGVSHQCTIYKTMPPKKITIDEYKEARPTTEQQPKGLFQ